MEVLSCSRDYETQRPRKSSRDDKTSLEVLITVAYVIMKRNSHEKSSRNDEMSKKSSSDNISRTQAQQNLLKSNPFSDFN